MNRYQIMDDFLKKMASIFKENDDKAIPYEEISKLIHTFFINIGVKNPDIDFTSPNNNIFARLNSYFKDSRNMKVYLDPDEGYFLQIQNTTEQNLNNIETIKLYIPQDAFNLERSARELFDFLDTSNISHISRISRKERFDNIVVQVNNWSDASKVLNFAAGNRQIKSGMLPANPFAFSVDNIAITTGHGGSFNNIATSLMTAYFNDKIINDKLDTVELTDFIKYSQDYYRHHFVDLRDIGEVVTDFELEGCEVSTNENNRKIADIGNVVELFLNGLDPMYNLDSFRKAYLENSNDGKLIGVANAIGLLRKETNTVNGSNFVGSIDMILLSSVDEFKEKYHIDEEHALKIIGTYLEDGNIQKITRSNNVRTKMLKGDFYNKLHKLLEMSGQDLKTYYENKKESRSIRALQYAIYQTYLKYEDRYENGFEQVDGYTRASYALENLIVNNSVLSFTRDNNARENLIKYGDNEVAITDIARSQGHELFLDDPASIKAACNNYVTNVISSKSVERGTAYTISA